MRDVLIALLTGLITGAVFALIKLPVPAPANVAGLMGIVGIFLGYILVKRFISW